MAQSHLHRGSMAQSHSLRGSMPHLICLGDPMPQFHLLWGHDPILICLRAYTASFCFITRRWYTPLLIGFTSWMATLYRRWLTISDRGLMTKSLLSGGDVSSSYWNQKSHVCVAFSPMVEEVVAKSPIGIPITSWSLCRHVLLKYDVAWHVVVSFQIHWLSMRFESYVHETLC